MKEDEWNFANKCKIINARNIKMSLIIIVG